MTRPICPVCGLKMRCAKNEILVEVDGAMRSGDLYVCNEITHVEYAVRGLGAPLSAPEEEK